MSDVACHAPRAAPSERLAGLQTLRAVAALMVLAGHTLSEVQHLAGRPLPLADLPWSRGVDIFFVISGFVVALSAERFQGRPLAFLQRRAIRVVPLYWLFTTCMVAVLLIAPSGTKDTTFDPAQIAASYVFLPFERYDGRIAPVLSLGWTLNYEMAFYVAAAACLPLARPLYWLGIGLLGAVAFGAAFDPASAPLLTWTTPLLLEFLAGIALARIWRRRGTRPDPVLAAGLCVAALGLLLALDGSALPRAVSAGGPALLAVAAATLFWPAGAKPLQSLGAASYALYLSHRFALRAVTLALGSWAGSAAGAASLVALAIVAALGLALLVHRHVEGPMLAALNYDGRR